MAILLDTNLLGRLANRLDPSYPTAQNAISTLHRQQETLHITAQNLVEFRNFATRPTSANGLGLSPTKAAAIAASFEAAFPLLEETPDIYPAWRTLVDGLGIIGKQVHDARLVAVCQVHGVDQLLTFNDGDFRRLTTIAPFMTVIHPASV